MLQKKMHLMDEGVCPSSWTTGYIDFDSVQEVYNYQNLLVVI